MSKDLKKDLEQQTETFLKTFDPYYSSHQPNKMKLFDNPYETEQQIKRRKRKEIPFSTLKKNNEDFDAFS